MTVTSEPFTRIRARTAQRLRQAVVTKPQVTLFTTARTDSVRAVLADVAARRPEERVTLTPILISVLAGCAREDPALSGWIVGDEIRRLDQVNVGVAVQAERGLFTPVVLAADTLGLDATVAEYERLVAGARAGSLGPADMLDATITLTNLGGFRVSHFTPLVDPPEIAIVGVGRASAAGASEELPISLSFDHAAVDGATAAAFLTRFADAVESCAEVAACASVDRARGVTP